MGVIAPYSAQVKHVTHLLQQAGYLASQDLDGSSELKAMGTAACEVEVNSVDGFQGREKDVVIFSTVRSNTQKQIGFLRDYKRLNVALTRARKTLIVVGDSSTLEGQEVWGEYIKYCRYNNLVLHV